MKTWLFIFFSCVFSLAKAQDNFIGVWFTVDGSFEMGCAIEDQTIIYNGEIWTILDEQVEDPLKKKVLHIQSSKENDKFIALKIKQDDLIIQDGKQISYFARELRDNQSYSNAEKIFPSEFSSGIVTISGILPEHDLYSDGNGLSYILLEI